MDDFNSEAKSQLMWLKSIASASSNSFFIEEVDRQRDGLKKICGQKYRKNPSRIKSFPLKNSLIKGGGQKLIMKIDHYEELKPRITKKPLKRICNSSVKTHKILLNPLNEEKKYSLNRPDLKTNNPKRTPVSPLGSQDTRSSNLRDTNDKLLVDEINHKGTRKSISKESLPGKENGVKVLSNVDKIPKTTTLELNVTQKSKSSERSAHKQASEQILKEDKMENKKRDKSYDPEAARTYMKQKRTERGATLAEKQRNKIKEKEDIKKKLEELRQKQINLVKNCVKRDNRQNKPEWVGLLDSAGGSCSNPQDILKSFEKAQQGLERAKSPQKDVHLKQQSPAKQPKRNLKRNDQAETFEPPSDINWPDEFITGGRLGLEPDELKTLTARPPKKRDKTNPAEEKEQQKVAPEELSMTNEFMLQVSQQMKMLTEHFKTLSEKKVPVLKDSMAQTTLYINEASRSSENVNKHPGDWVDLPYTEYASCKNVSSHLPKRCYSEEKDVANVPFIQKPISISENKPKDFMGVVRRRLDFIQQLKEEEEREKENTNRILISDSNNQGSLLKTKSVSGLQSSRNASPRSSSRKSASSPKKSNSAPPSRSNSNTSPLRLMTRCEKDSLKSSSKSSVSKKDLSAVSKNSASIQVNLLGEVDPLSLKEPSKLISVALVSENISGRDNSLSKGRRDIPVDICLRGDSEKTKLSDLQALKVEEYKSNKSKNINKRNFISPNPKDSLKINKDENTPKAATSFWIDIESLPISEELMKTSLKSDVQEMISENIPSKEFSLLDPHLEEVNPSSGRGNSKPLPKCLSERSDTTISESLSTDPLKLPESLDRLSLTLDQIPALSEKSIILSESKRCDSKSALQQSLNEFRLDTSHISKLSVKDIPSPVISPTPPEEEFRQTLSEISEKLIVNNSSHSASKKIEINSDKSKIQTCQSVSPPGSSKTKYKDRFKQFPIEELIPLKTRKMEQSKNSNLQSDIPSDESHHSTIVSSVGRGHSRKSDEHKFKIPSTKDNLPQSFKNEVANQEDSLARLNERFRNDYINQELTVTVRYQRGSSQSAHPSNVSNIDTNTSSSSGSSMIPKCSKALHMKKGSFTSSCVNELLAMPSFSSTSIHDQVAKEMKNLDLVNENLSHALARSKALSLENVHQHQILTSSMVKLPVEDDTFWHSVQPSLAGSSNHLSGLSTAANADRKDFKTGDLDTIDSSMDITQFYLRMFENLIKDEELRYRQKTSLLEMRRSALFEKTKTALDWLAIERKRLKAKGKEEALRSIKKKERGIILKCHQDFDEITRLQKSEKEASKDRLLLLKRQIHLVMMQMNTKKYVQHCMGSTSGEVKLPSHTLGVKNLKTPSKINLESQKRELEMKEAQLLARRQKLEAVSLWTKKVEEEEKRLLDVEKLISPQNASPQRQQMCVDRGTSPLNFTSESSGSRVLESIPSNSQQNPAPNQNSNSHSEGEKAADYYSDSFEQASAVSENVVSHPYSNPDKSSEERRKSMVSIKVPLSPRVPPTKRRHSSGSDESMLYSHNETSEASDLEVRVSWLQQQLKLRKSELEHLKKQHSKSQRERLKAKEQSLISQINAYDAYIEQVKNEIQQDLVAPTVKVMKPQIKQPRVAEKRKSDVFVSDKKADESPIKSESVGEESSENTDTIKTLLESSLVGNKLDSQTKATDEEICKEDSLITVEDISKESSPVKSEEDSLTATSHGKTVDEDFLESSEKQSIDISDVINDDDIISENICDLKDSIIYVDVKNKLVEEEEVKSDVISEEFNVQAIGDQNVTSEKPSQIEEKISSPITEASISAIKTDTKNEESLEDISPMSNTEEFSEKIVESKEASIEEDSYGEEFSSESDVESVKTESLIRSLTLSDKEFIESVTSKIAEVDDKKIESSVDSEEQLKESDAEHEKSIGSEIEESLNTLTVAPLEVPSSLSSLYSLDKFESVSASLLSAIQSNKQEVVFNSNSESLPSPIKDNESPLHGSLFEQVEMKSEQNVFESNMNIEILSPLSDKTHVSTDEESHEASLINVGDRTYIVENLDDELDPLDISLIDKNDKLDIVVNEENKQSGLDDNLMLQMLEDSFAVSDRLWKANLEEYKKIKEETPFLTALQRENEKSNSVDGISQQLFNNFYESATLDILKIYFKKKAQSADAEKKSCVQQPPEPSTQGDGFEFYEEASDLKVQEESFWHDEACSSKVLAEKEKLRLEQLQIEQEIEKLEQKAAGMRGYYLREIPNKPPPPYTPPKGKGVPSEEEVINSIVVGVSAVWDSAVADRNTPPGGPPSQFLADFTSPPDSSYRELLWDLCVELYFKAKPPPPPPCPPWVILTKRRKLAPPPRTKEEMIEWAVKKASIILGYRPAVQKENMIIKWSRKKRDRVDEILVRESQEEEADWIDYSVEENQIKNRVAESIIDDMISEAAMAILNVFKLKFPS